MIYLKVCFIGGMPNGILFGLCTINDTFPLFLYLGHTSKQKKNQ